MIFPTLSSVSVFCQIAMLVEFYSSFSLLISISIALARLISLSIGFSSEQPIMQSIAGKTVLYAPIVLLILQCHVKADVSKPSVSSLLGHQARNDVEMFGLSKQLVAANVTEPTFPELERRQDKDPDVYDVCPPCMRSTESSKLLKH